MKRFVKIDLTKVIIWLVASSLIIFISIKILCLGELFSNSSEMRAHLIDRLDVDDIDIIEEVDTKHNRRFFYKTSTNLWGISFFERNIFGTFSFGSCSKGSNPFKRSRHIIYGVEHFIQSGFDDRCLIKKVDIFLDDNLIESFDVSGESFLVSKRVEHITGNRNISKVRYLNEHGKDITEYINETNNRTYHPTSVSESTVDEYLLSFQMRDGDFTNNVDEITPVKLRGPLYSGEFDLILKAKNGDELHRMNLNHYHSELSFPPNFYMNFDDYNDDGNPDFPIGQYFNENVILYRMFSIIDDILVELPFEKREFSGSFPDNRYSPKLEKTTDGFSVKSYNRDRGEYITTIYIWEDSNFIIKNNQY